MFGGGPTVQLGRLKPQQHTHLCHTWASKAEDGLEEGSETENLAGRSSRMWMASLPLGCTCTPLSSIDDLLVTMYKAIPLYRELYSNYKMV